MEWISREYIFWVYRYLQVNSHGLTFKDIQEHVLKFSRRKFSFRDAYFRRILKSVSDDALPK